MRILLTNDDGLTAPGIQALHAALEGLGEIITVAPATVQSAMSHKVTFHAPMLVHEVEVNPTMRGLAVEGSPAAAVESAFLGVPAIAVSLHLGRVDRIRFDRAAAIARVAIEKVLAHRIDPHSVININVPRTESDDAPVPPIRVVAMNTAAGADGFERRTGPRGQSYYWPNGNGMEFVHTREGSDVEALHERCITVTPLQYDLTDHARLASWRDRLARDRLCRRRGVATRRAPAACGS